MEAMNEQQLRRLLAGVTPPDEGARQAAHAHWAACAKPLGGLGLLETALEQAAALTGRVEPDFSQRAVLVLCADNGVVAEGVSQTGSEVTGIVARNLAAGRTSVCRMAATVNCRVLPVDMGIRDFAPTPGVLDCRIGNGTENISRGPAMTRAQAVQAIGAGIELVRLQKEAGFTLLAAGEMGIGNTTTASALLCALLGEKPASVTGRGAGLSDEGLGRKVAAIEKAHEERYRKLLKNVEMQQVFAKSGESMWECRVCGHLVVGKAAPEVCPVCGYAQSYFELRKENY